MFVITMGKGPKQNKKRAGLVHIRYVNLDLVGDWARQEVHDDVEAVATVQNPPVSVQP